MKMIFKTALLAATIVGTTSLVPTLASAQVGITVGIGAPAPHAYAPCGYGYGPCSNGYNPYDGGYYYDPVFFDGSWYHGPYRWRTEHGQRVFWIDGGWHRNEWSGGAYPDSITFRNGGEFRGGRYEGFGDADRINARFHSGNASMRDMRPESAPDREHMDRGSMNPQRLDNSNDRQGPAHDDGDVHHNDADGPHN